MQQSYRRVQFFFKRLPAAAGIVSVIISLMTFSGRLSAQTGAETGGAERRARAYFEAINTGRRPVWREFLRDNFSKASFERFPLEARLSNFSRTYDLSRGFTIENVGRTPAGEISIVAVSKLTGQKSEFTFTAEKEPPFHLVSVGMRPHQAAAGRPVSESEVAAELDAFVKKMAEAGLFSGAVLLAKGDRVLYEKAFGEANKDFRAANNTETKFNLGSMNKMFTAVAVAQLVEAGKLSFDDPLGKFMPDFPDREAAEKIKIKHLLSHTSGLGSYFNRTFIEASRARFRTVDDFLELAKDEKMQFEPGSRWQYSNTGMLVLGKVIEKASGQDYFQYVRENIYKKAGMTNSDSYDLDTVNANLAVGYEKEYGDSGHTFRNNIFQHVIRGGPAGGGYSTVGDLFRFARALESGKLIGREYVKILTTPKPELNSPNYGYGFGVGSDPVRTGHSGGFPGISSELIMFTDSGHTAVVLSNYGFGSQPVVFKIQELMRACRDCSPAKK